MKREESSSVSPKVTADDFVHEIFTAEDGTELSCYMYMPEGAENLPLMVWEHGGGEALSLSSPGANLTASRGAVAWIENGFETAVLSVQYPENYSFGITGIPEEFEKMKAFGKAKYELIQKMIKEGKVDPARIYISGCSSGGGASLRMIMQYPDLFAGALVICAKDTIVPISKPYGFAYQFGGNDLLKLSEEAYEEVYDAMEKEMEKVDITSTPIWFVQAEHDQICTSYTSRILFDILKKQGAAANRLTIWSDEEMEAFGMPQKFYHGAWVPALENKEMLSWVYDQHK